MNLLIIAYGLSFISLIFCVYNHSYQKYYLLSKVITSSLFLCIALFWLFQTNQNGIWLMGFLFCFIGDVLLGIKKNNLLIYFPWGLLSFLFGHIMFIGQMIQVQALSIQDFLFPILMVCVSYGLVRLKSMDVKKYKMAIYGYAFIVSLLLSKSFSCSSIGLILGCFFFFMSDFLLLFHYFYKKKWKGLKFLNLLLYYSAVFILIFTLP